eukprot:m.257380 g.257380  ORF g.257380 m.257380 type:complete len:120 (+) comp15527_c1_seq3:52-411(+)
MLPWLAKLPPTEPSFLSFCKAAVAFSVPYLYSPMCWLVYHLDGGGLAVGFVARAVEHFFFWFLFTCIIHTITIDFISCVHLKMLSLDFTIFPVTCLYLILICCSCCLFVVLVCPRARHV